MSLSFLASLGGVAEELEQFDLRDRRDDVRDLYEPVEAGPVEEETSTAGAVARYRRLSRGGSPAELIARGVELLSLGAETRALAVEAFKRAGRFEGAGADSLFWLGEAHAEAGEPDAAMRYYRESLDFDVRPLTLTRLYQVQSAEGLDEAAAATLEKIRLLDEDVDDPEAPAM